MTVTELIFKLQQAYFKYGDVPIYIQSDEESECNGVIYLAKEENNLHNEAHLCLTD